MRFITKQEEGFDKYRFGWMSLMLMSQACLGSIAAYISILNDHWFFVSVCVVAAMGCITMFIAQASAKVCLIAFYLSITLSTIVLILSVFMFYL